MRPSRLELERQPRNLSEWPWFTFGMCVSLVTAFLLELPGASPSFLLTGSGPAPPAVALLAVSPSAVVAGQYQRLLTGAFVHAGLQHFFINLLALLILGISAERRFGKIRLAIIYIGSALAGNLAATIVSPGALTLGASGAIMGVAGSLITIMVRFRVERNTLIGVISMVTATLSYGLLHGGVSNEGHIVGLIAGFVLAWVVGTQPAWTQIERRVQEKADRLDTELARYLEAQSAGATPIPPEVLANPTNRLVLRGTSGRRTVTFLGGMLFSGLCLVVAVVTNGPLQIVVGSAIMTAVSTFMGWRSWRQKLILGPDGFEYLVPLFGSLRCRWVEVYRFEPMVIGNQQMVRFGFPRHKAGSPSISWKDLPTVAGMNADKQAQLLEEWLRRWTDRGFRAPYNA
jgi:membrane associated rhomboid family serine protease